MTFFYSKKNYNSDSNNKIEHPANNLIKVLLIGPIIAYLVYEVNMIILYKPSIGYIIYWIGVESSILGTVYSLYVLLFIYLIAPYEDKKIRKIFKILLSVCFLSFFTVFLIPYILPYIGNSDEILRYNKFISLNADQLDELMKYITHIKREFMITIIMCVKLVSPFFFLLIDIYIKFIDLIVYYISDIDIEKIFNSEKFGPFKLNFDLKYVVSMILLFLPLILLIKQIISLLYNIFKK